MEQSIVLTSGVSASFRDFSTEEQTQMAKRFGQAAFKYILGTCVSQIGNVSNPGEEFCSRLLSPDKSQLLWAIRQYTLGDPPKYTFELPWGLNPKTGKQETQAVTVDLNDRHFKPLPFLWVDEQWRKDAYQAFALKKNAPTLTEEGQKDLAEGNEEEFNTFLDTFPFPVMYGSYEEMLAKHKAFRIQVEGKTMELQFPDIAGEETFAATVKGNLDTVKLLELYNPRWVDTDGEEEAFKYAHPTRNSPRVNNFIYDEIMARNAVQNSEVTVSRTSNPAETKVVNLFNTVGFFLPLGTRRKR